MMIPTFYCKKGDFMETILVTGGAGFIGSNFIIYMLGRYGNKYRVINIDALTYAGNIENLSQVIDFSNYSFYHGSINDDKILDAVFKNKIDYIVNFASESHVDNSIENPLIFYETNVVGTVNLLKYGHKYGIRRFYQISTDEVYGSSEDGFLFNESSPLKPSSPYSSSKAAADLAVLAFGRTYGMDVVISRSCNNFGPRQHKEKLIPKVIDNISKMKKIPIYGNGLNKRSWLHVDDHVEAIDKILFSASSGEIYNIGSFYEIENINLVKSIMNVMDMGHELIEYVEDRPGHDYSYSMVYDKVKNLGWKQKVTLEDGLKKLVI